MANRPLVEERYTNGTDTINYVIYKSSVGSGNDEVLQHKLAGTSETAQITLHPDGVINFRVTRNKKYLEEAVKNELKGFSPSPSRSVRQFIAKVLEKI